MLSNSKNTIIHYDDLKLDEKLNALPTKPGVYRFTDTNGKVLYIGKAHNLRSRVKQYFHKSNPNDTRIGIMVSKIADVEIVVTDNEIEALILEANLIKQFKPKYNVLLKDDKSYPFIAIMKEQYPRAIITRRNNLNALYFGPYTDVRSMRNALKTIRDIFYIRSCNYDLTETTINQKKYKVCLDYHIKKCEGPCEDFVSRIEYNKKIDNAIKVLKGRVKEVLIILNNEMNTLSDLMRYEEAAIVREKINALKVYYEKQKIIDNSGVERDVVSIVSEENDACAVIFKIREGKVVNSHHFYLTNVYEKNTSELLEYFIERYYMEQEDVPAKLLLSENPDNIEIIKEWLRNKIGASIEIELPSNTETKKLTELVKTNAKYWLEELKILRLKRGETIPHVLMALKRDLNLKAIPRRIECFDISNIQGADAVASLVVFIDGKPKKSEYRKYLIKTVNQPNDYASMKEVIERRYTKQQATTLPDLIVVDGGKGQLSSAIEVIIKLNIDEIPIIGLAKRLEEIFMPNKSDPIILPRTTSSLRLLQQIRDEAHRFAITFHRNRRSKRMIHTELEEIKGVGKNSIKKLMEAFGSIEEIKKANSEQLEKIIGKTIAKNIIEYFKNSKKQS